MGVTFPDAGPPSGSLATVWRLHISHLCPPPTPLWLDGAPTAIARCYRAETRRARLIGLLGTGEPEPDEALLIPGCRAVHGWGMRVPVDCLFLDRRGAVLSRQTLRRGGSLHCRWAAAVLECRLGALPQVSLGATLAQRGLPAD